MMADVTGTPAPAPTATPSLPETEPWPSDERGDRRTLAAIVLARDGGVHKTGTTVLSGHRLARAV